MWRLLSLLGRLFRRGKTEPLERPDLEKFFGKSYVLEDAPSTMAVEKKPYRLDFYAHELQGVTVFKDMPDPVDLDKLEAILTEDGIKPGDTIIVPGLVGEHFRATIRADGRSFENKALVGWLEFGKDIRKCWVCLGMGNRLALARVDFV